MIFWICNMVFNCYLPPHRRPGMGDIETPLYVCLSVKFNFCTVTRKRIADFDPKCGGGECGGGGGVRKTIISHFLFSSRFMLFPTFFEKIVPGGGGWKETKFCGVSFWTCVAGRSPVTELLFSLVVHMPPLVHMPTPGFYVKAQHDIF